MANACLIDLLPLVMCKKHTTVHKKCVPLVRKIVLVTFAVTHSFNSSERLFNGEKLWAMYLPHT